MALNPPQPTASLFLRVDGSLLLVRGDSVTDIQLTPTQLVQLGMDAFRVATSLNPACMGDVLQALESTIILPDNTEVAPCPPQLN